MDRRIDSQLNCMKQHKQKHKLLIPGFRGEEKRGSLGPLIIEPEAASMKPPTLSYQPRLEQQFEDRIMAQTQRVIVSKDIYHGLPTFPEDLNGLTAIVTGANGISGDYMVGLFPLRDLSSSKSTTNVSS